MLEPSQFQPNEAWIVFRLNGAPISTQEDGEFNVVCLMDAASCYILDNEFVSVYGSPVPSFAARRLLARAQNQAGCLPIKCYLSSELQTGELSVLAEKLGVEVIPATEPELSRFTSEAKEGFLAHIGGGKVQ